MKTAVITGANAGIGFATARFLAGEPDWHVLLACRSESKAQAALQSISREHPRASVSAALLDLYCLASIRRFSDEVAAGQLPPIHGLVLNARRIWRCSPTPARRRIPPEVMTLLRALQEGPAHGRT